MSRYPPSSPSLDVPSHNRYSSSSSSSLNAPTSPRSRSSFSASSRLLTSAPGSSAYDMPLDQLPHRRAQSGGGGGLPLPIPGRRGGVSARWTSRRLRWVVLAGLVLGVWLWRSGGDEGVETIEVGPVEKGVEETGREVFRAPEETAAAMQEEEEKEYVPPPPPKLKPKPRPADPPADPAHPLPPPPLSSPLDSSPLDVSVRPSPSSYLTTPPSPSERFLAYSPHSGYHNQRISLENALTLAFLLKRTLLVPPVWFGHAIPYISFDKLQRRLEMASKEGLEHCIPFGEGSAADPIPRECNGFWDWTVVDWSFLVDLSSAAELVPLRSRSNLSSAWLDEELSLRPPKKRGGVSPDVYQLQDDTMYQYRFYDTPEDDEPLAKWGNRVDVDRFKAETYSFKLVHVGTLFGTSRIRATKEKTYDARSVFRKAMVFRTDVVDEITEQVRDALGGEGKYYGLHLRVGDGVFQKEARGNMRGVWEKLCGEKMKLEERVCEEVRKGVEEKLRRRSAVQEEGDGKVEEDEVEESPPSSASLVKRANSRPQREGAFHHAPLPPLSKIRTLSDSPLAPSLTCRSPLHTAPKLLPFNTPLFIATDSKLPQHDPNLALFFSAFPCAFVLSDFAHLPALKRMDRMRNEEDKAPLAGFLYPQLDAQIAAWGRGLVGTPQSTYSRFAVDVLHQVYHGWEIVERG